MKYFQFAVIISVFSIAYSSGTTSKWKKQSINSKEIYVKNDDDSTTEEQVNEDYLIIKKFYDQLSSFKGQKEAADKGIDSIELKKELKTMNYTIKNGEQFFLICDIDSNKIIRYARFSDKSKKMTNEEKMFFYHSKKNPESYVNVSKDEAAELAVKALQIVYGEKEAIKFDSLEIDEDEGDYHIYFKVKMKNDIMDWRMASFTVNANSGQITYIKTDGLPKKGFDINYKPKISKEKALEMFNAKVKELNATIDITFIGICDFIKKGICDTSRKTWTIYGKRKDVYTVSNSGMIIDCETGEIIVDLNY
jgi:hypothetical protein